MTNRQLTFSEERIDVSQRIEETKTHRTPISILLNNVQDLRNIGSIFRIADALKIEHIYIYGFQGVWNLKKLKKYGRSTLSHVPHSFLEKQEDLVEILNNHHVVALEKTDKSKNYTDFKPIYPLLLIIGNESHGISPYLLKIAMQTIHLPMLGVNTSLNVSNATAIALYHIHNQL